MASRGVSACVEECLVGLAVVVLFTLLTALAPSAWAAPANDDFERAAPLRLGDAIRGTVEGATRQRREPQHARSLAGRSVWYRFRAQRRLALRLNTCRTDFDSVIAVYTGRSLPSLRAVDFNDNGCGPTGGSRVTVTTHRGQTYRIAVAGATARGRFRLQLDSVPTPPNDDFVDALPIKIGSSSRGSGRYSTSELGEPHRGGSEKSVWYTLATPRSTHVRLNACAGVTGGSVRVYTGLRVNRLREILTYGDGGCDEQFAARAGATYRVQVRISRYRYRLVAKAVDPPPNDDFANATPITLGGTTSGATRYATREFADPAPSEFERTVWFRLSVTTVTRVRLDACGINRSGPALSVYTGERLAELTRVTTTVDCTQEFAAQPGVYALEAEHAWEVDFSLSAQALNAPP